MFLVREDIVVGDVFNDSITNTHWVLTIVGKELYTLQPRGGGSAVRIVNALELSVRYDRLIDK